MKPDELVQAIVVVEREGLTHEHVVRDVANLSVFALLIQYRMSCLQNTPIDPNWEAWLNGSFTKTVRRLKPKLAYKLKGFVVSRGLDDEREMAAYAPMRYDELPAVVKRAQVAGLDLPRTNQPLHPQAPIQIHINPHIEMTTGKTAAQAAHGLMAWVLKQGLDTYTPGNIPFGLSYSENFDDIEAEVDIIDAGYTELPPQTLTIKVTHCNQEVSDA